MELKAKWNSNSEQVDFSRMSPRSERFSKLPNQKTCEKNVLLLIFMMLISMALWGILLFLFLTRFKAITQDLEKLQQSCMYHNDSGTVTIINQLQGDQLDLKNNASHVSQRLDRLEKDGTVFKSQASHISEQLDRLEKDSTVFKSQASHISEQLDRLEKDSTVFKSQVLNEKSTTTKAREKLQEEIEKLWTEFQRANGSACTNCLKDWQLFQKKCYFFGKESKTWVQAKFTCINLKGRLVSIKNKEEQAFLTQKANKKGSWIGLRDLDIEGEFIWMDGSPLNYTNWSPGEPNNQGQGEDCVAMLPHNGLWNDAYCRLPLESWICERLATC